MVNKHRNRINTLILTFILSLGFFSCAHIQIERMEIIETTDTYLILEVETSEDIREYDDSNHAHEVYLDYSVFVRKEHKVIEDQSDLRPFGSDRLSDHPKTSTLLSYWKIPIKDESDMVGYWHTEYETYDLSDGREYILTFNLLGGTMIGTEVSSNAFSILYPPQSNLKPPINQKKKEEPCSEKQGS